MADHPTEYRDEREEARARLRSSVDALAYQANLQVQMQKEPLKLLGGASAVGAVVGLVVGRQFKRSKKVYVDAYSPEKHQKALIKAQKKQKGGGVGGALVATLTTMAFKTLNDKVITPKLEEMANNLLDKAGQPGHGHKPGASTSKPGVPRPLNPAPLRTGGAASFLKHPEAEATAPVPGAVSSAVSGSTESVPVISGTLPASSSLPTPVSTVEAKAKGSPIDPGEKANPNLR